MDEYLKRNIAHRMMNWVLSLDAKVLSLDAKYVIGVFADINKNFTDCDNTGIIGAKGHISCVSPVRNGYKRYEFKGFDWTEETLMLELEKLCKINLIKKRVEDLKKDFQ